jgi:catechol 2,3-dioxygenase-like lactoylglutathione lyase family enzyme
VERPEMTVTNVVLGAPDARELAGFYSKLLGWQVRTDEPDWVTLPSPLGGMSLAFQQETEHVPPVWPAGPGDQQMMAHLDIEVHDLEAAGAFAVTAGARLAEFQPQQNVRVFLDPAGHPFCLWVAT